MKRLGISVEGATEREFVSRVLRKHLQPFGIQATGVDLGGGVSLDKIRGVLPALLGSFDHVSTLYDFYGFKGRNGRGVVELEDAIQELVGTDIRHRLTSYLQQYEFETLLFAVPEQTNEWLNGPPASLEELKRAVRLAGSAERVNDSVQTSPSHRLKVIFPRYDKKLHGPEIVEIAGLNRIRAECPRFDGWVAQLERLGDRRY
jgi:hypothetical protein